MVRLILNRPTLWGLVERLQESGGGGTPDHPPVWRGRVRTPSPPSVPVKPWGALPMSCNYFTLPKSIFF